MIGEMRRRPSVGWFNFRSELNVAARKLVVTRARTAADCGDSWYRCNSVSGGRSDHTMTAEDLLD